MRKLFLLLFVSISVAHISAQLNLVNDGYFINTGITSTIGPNKDYPGINFWYPYLFTDKQNEIYVTASENFVNSNAAGIKVTTESKPNWTCGLAQRLSAPDHGIYKVSFWGKTMSSTQNTYMRVFLRVDDVNSSDDSMKSASKYFRRVHATNTTVTTDQFFTNEWKYYSVDFDLSKVKTNAETTFSDATAADIQDFSLYFTNFAAARAGDLQITGVKMTKVETTDKPTTWYNPDFELGYGVPHLITNSSGTAIRAQETTTKGVWNLALMDGITDATKSKATVVVDSTEAYSGKRSMKLNVKYVRDFSKVVLASTLFDLPKDDYVFSFYAKTDIDGVPFRVDVDNYTSSKEGFNKLFPFSGQATIRENHLSSTEWTKYTVEFNNTSMSDTLTFAIRPNITAAGGSGDWAEREVTYWFDNFTIEKNTGTSNNKIELANEMVVLTEGNSVLVSNVNNDLVELIDLSGRVLGKQVPKLDFVQFSVPSKGVYIIRSARLVKKVVVR